MKRPEVPQAAIDAAADAQIRHLYPLGAPGEGEMDTAMDESRLMLAAAAPHIGAAYLRWLAEDDDESDGATELDLLELADRIEAGDE